MRICHADSNRYYVEDIEGNMVASFNIYSPDILLNAWNNRTYREYITGDCVICIDYPHIKVGDYIYASRIIPVDNAEYFIKLLKEQ